MAKQEFMLDHALFCVASALGKRGYCDTIPKDLLRFLTGKAPSWLTPEASEITTVTCGLILIKQHPWLEGPVQKTLKSLRPGNKAFRTDRLYRNWLAEQERRFGMQISVSSISAGELKSFQATARDIAYNNLNAKGIDLNANPSDWGM